LVTLFTLGAVHYSNEVVDSVSDEVHYIGTKRLSVGIVVLIVVGCLFISGGVIPQVLRVVYKLVNLVNGVF